MAYCFRALVCVLVIGIADSQDVLPKLWPQGRIPYKFNAEAKFKATFDQAVQIIMNRTGGCVEFYEVKDTDTQFIDVTSYGACWTSTGMVGHSFIDGGDGCFSLGLVLHGLMHALGFEEEHRRSDRDSYVTLNPQNALSFMREKFTQKFITHNEVNAFDFDSVLMYGAYQYSINQKATISPKDTGRTWKDLDDKQDLSDSDVERIRTLYSCQSDD